MIDPIAHRIALAWRVARRFQADQRPGGKENARKRTQPINPPKGIMRDIVKENGEEMRKGQPDTVKPERKGIQPKDVFTPTPDNTGVRDFAESGTDLQHALKSQIPKDKGYETVKNLSQYLIRTDGGGEGGPEGRKL